MGKFEGPTQSQANVLPESAVTALGVQALRGQQVAAAYRQQAAEEAMRDWRRSEQAEFGYVELGPEDQIPGV